MPREREKMVAGELYDPFDDELVQARLAARELTHALNLTKETDTDLRRRLLTALLGSGGEDLWMQPPFYCDYGFNIHFGTKCFFNFNCVMLDICPIRIGDRTMFGPAVQIYAASHPLDFELRRTLEFGKPVTIGSDVWIGGGAIICPGVTIGSCSVIGAGSVVTKNIPEGVLAVGNPARVVKQVR